MNKKSLSVLLLISVAIVFSTGSAWSEEKEMEKAPAGQAAGRLVKLPAAEQGGTGTGVEKEAAHQMLQQFQLFPPDVQIVALKKTYSIMHTEFTPYHQNIIWASDGGSSNRYVSKCGIAVCGLEAPVHLPDGAHITGYSCKVLDNSTTHPVGIVLSWTKGDQFSYSSTSCMSSTSTASASAAIQSIDNSTCNLTVDNKVYAYAISFNTYEGGSGGTICESGGKNCKIYTCYVNYY